MFRLIYLRLVIGNHHVQAVKRIQSASMLVILIFKNLFNKKWNIYKTWNLHTISKLSKLYIFCEKKYISLSIQHKGYTRFPKSNYFVVQSRQGLCILSCEEAIKLAYWTSVVLLGARSCLKQCKEGHLRYSFTSKAAKSPYNIIQCWYIFIILWGNVNLAR